MAASARCLPECSEGPAFRRRNPILPLAQDEYINAYGTDSRREIIRISHDQSADHTSPDSQIAPSASDAFPGLAR